MTRPGQQRGWWADDPALNRYRGITGGGCNHTETTYEKAATAQSVINRKLKNLCRPIRHPAGVRLSYSLTNASGRT